MEKLHGWRWSKNEKILTNGSVADRRCSYQSRPRREIPHEHSEVLMFPGDFDHAVA
jgi:hypothetical protein